jgi:hypothetical protein
MSTKVFISYAHESTELAKTVLDLSDYLRSKGVDAEIDQYEESPPEGWPKWMMRQIQEAEYVLLICSKLFHERANDFSGKKEGLGVKWETSLILQQLYAANTNNTKFIPVIATQHSVNFIPLPLQPYTYYDISDADKKQQLLNRLLGISTSKRPALGEPSVSEPLPPKERKSMFITSIINIELWDQARWKAVAFMSDPSLTKPPIIGFVFEDATKGNEIFSEIKERFGNRDEKEEIRLSFIEIISDKTPQDYKVHIGTDWKTLTEKLKENNLNPDESLVMSISRIHEMNPSEGSKNIAVFKHSYSYFKKYFITNFDMIDGKLHPNFNNLIEKSTIYFRVRSEVIKDRNDPDFVVFSENQT